MQIYSDIYKTQTLCKQWRDKGESIAFVPTMGCLHAGHLSLIKQAKLDAEHVVVSIFVNPLQFDNTDDLMKYPHTLADDVDILTEIGVELLFNPSAESFYPKGQSEVKKIELGAITDILEGAARPGHFAGVATVVKCLFDLIQPDIAIFGEKDFQQLIVVQQLVEKFRFDIKIIGMPTFREEDGLAMSSRNVHLNTSERTKAGEIYQQLKLIKSAINSGETSFLKLEQQASENLISRGFATDYVTVRETTTLLTPKVPYNSMVILIAAKLGEIRLIDNLRV